ncbi:MAG: hypothetical protein IPP80_13860 [Ignavibacteria bacterium]|nr:hypothetical protein [Ignavibacteria bacterium]
MQVSAAHTRAHLDKAIAAFGAVGKELGVIHDHRHLWCRDDGKALPLPR